RRAGRELSDLRAADLDRPARRRGLARHERPRRRDGQPLRPRPRHDLRRRRHPVSGSAMSLNVGLTGGIASAKSTVSRRLRELGAVVIDYHQLARDVVEPGTPALAAIVERFGPTVIDDAGRLDRPGL